MHNDQRFIDSLERRRLLATDFAVLTSRGTLNVTGTVGDDVILISTTKKTVDVQRDDRITSFTRSLVERINVNSFKGDDRITNNTSFRSTLTGAGGRDTLIGGNVGDLLDGGEGLDLADYSDGGGAVVVNIDGGDGSTLFPQQPDNVDTLASTEIVNGTKFNDSFKYVNGVTLRGLDGNDRFREFDISGMPAVIDAGNGADLVELRSAAATTIRGGAGDDQVTMDFQAKPASFDGGAGSDSISLHGNINPTLDFASNVSVERIADVGDAMSQKVTGSSGAEKISVSSTSAFGCTILGGGGNDTLVGGSSADSLGGGAGIDTVDYYNSASKVLFNINRVEDDHGKAVPSTATSGAIVDQLAADIENYIGTTKADRFEVAGGFFFSQKPYLFTLDARGGNDYLLEDGSNLKVTMLGGAGKDKFVVHEDCDTTVVGGSGNDIVTSAEANAFSGGSDKIDLGAGNDTLDLFGELGGNQKQWNLAAFTSTENIVNISSLMSVTGNDGPNLLAFIDDAGQSTCTIIGEGGDDTIIGSTGKDSLLGGDGDDSIVSQGGGDDLDGGLGDDLVK